MRSRIDLFIIFFFIHLSGSLFAQSTTNRGTDFWVAYMAHTDGTSSNMSLFITSDVNTSGTVSIPLEGWSTSFNVTANSVTTITIPTGTAYDSCSDCIQNKGINVTSVLPVVVYAEIYHSERSEATLVLPVPTLGKEYYAITFTQAAGGGGILGFGGETGYSEFLVVATQDSTQVEITPTQTTLNGYPANLPFTVTLNQGQIYQVQSQTDLTGSHILSYSSGTYSCKRIAVFSGSTWNAIGCGGGGSGDNLLEQCYPVNAWGNNFVTAPFATRIGGDEFRIFAGSDNTSVSINGGTPFVLNAGQFSDSLLATANYITASKPVTLAQYSRSQNCDNITGDPSMVIILPLEQTLDSITLYSTPQADMTEEFINVIMKTADTGSFLLDGNPVPFFAVPSNPLYAYSQITVDSGNHVLVADSGFNAIAYGFGDVDGYSYCAGANVRNLNQYITVIGGTAQNPRTVCSGATIYFSGVVSYTPASAEWYFGDGDTSSSLSTSHSYHTPGTYTISLVTVGDLSNSCATKDSSTYVLTITPFNTGTITALHDTICDGTIGRLNVAGNSGSVQWQSSATQGNFANIAGAIDTTYSALISQTTYFRIYTISGSCVDTSTPFRLTVIPPPAVSFTSSVTGQQVIFNSNVSNGTDYYWDFGDGGNSTQANPSHTYDTAGTHHVCLTITDNTNCTFTSCQNVTTFPNGVNNLNAGDEFEVYPNPFGNSIFIDGRELNEGISNVTVYDLLGRIVFSEGYGSQKMIELPLFYLSAGMYYLDVKAGDANYFKPIIKQ